ncbi:hypothetical protein B0A52_10109 [Exophiala mesophila]|uniref:Alpha/beta hydrolase fold-3 domain-containing protein n=1 Tax=Exophiala mesophila TaxID=212818 RepID=A0A438MQX4_EXOME|nr:hypothetical protein B0A52_10109 [Exophiala mesophila]
MHIAVVRTMLTCLTPRQIVQVLPGTQDTYSRWVRRKQGSTMMIAPESTVFADGITRLHWIKDVSGSPKSIVLFFHGGGYNAPLSDGHLDWCYNMFLGTKSQGNHVAVALLQYVLTPENRYPAQLRQARDALQYLLDLNFDPANIIIGGDSAGGNLALGLLSHIMHPHPSIESLNMAGPLRGAFLVSPWLTNDASTRSFRDKADIDMLSPALIRRSAEDYLPETSPEGWALAMAAPKDWWTDLRTAVEEVYLTVGEHELFRDHVVEFSETLKRHQGGTNVRFEVGRGEAHDHILTLHFRRTAVDPPLERMLDWLRCVLK